MKKGELLVKGIKSENYNYDIILVNDNPVEIGVFYNSKKVYKISLDETVIFNTQESLDNLIMQAVEILKSEISMKFVDRCINEIG